MTGCWRAYTCGVARKANSSTEIRTERLIPPPKELPGVRTPGTRLCFDKRVMRRDDLPSSVVQGIHAGEPDLARKSIAVVTCTLGCRPAGNHSRISKDPYQ